MFKPHLYPLLLGLPLLAALIAPAADKPSSPLSPSAALAAFRLADDKLLIELVAAEPDVVSPVAIAWDEDGRMFVAEMSDYPVGPPGGRVRLLQDPDADGRYRKVTVFADNLPFPNGVLPWKGGVLVTAAPHIWSMKDTDGDGRADEKRVLLTGFHEGNHQLRVNGLLWGLDNWIYGANGRSEGKVRRPADPPDKAVSISRRDFRFRPDTGEVQAVAGFSQFGLARDDWGNRFPSWNTAPLRHVVLEDRYLSRNPYLAAAAAVAHLADPADSGRLFSVSPRPATFNREPLDFFNASCGNTVYRGDLLGEAYRGNLLVCEPLTNLVHRRLLAPAGPTFVAKRADQGKEFLASTDPWFHPVNLTTGPDGALYVVDFYRQWVEHPDFVPKELRSKYDWRKGHEYGRIWRIRARHAKPGPLPRPGRASAAELVKHLGDPNGWRRDTAQRLLVERRDHQTMPLLKDAVRHEKLIQARVHALWTLDGLQALDDATRLDALRDAHPRVRQHAVRLSEGRLTGSAELTGAVLRLANDPDGRVRFQCALALGGLQSPDALDALARIARRDVADEWFRLAVASGLGETAWPFLQILLAASHSSTGLNPVGERLVANDWLHAPTSDQALFLVQVSAVVGARRREAELAECLKMLTPPAQGKGMPGRLALLAGLGEGMARSGGPLPVVLAKPPPALQEQAHALDRLLQFARETALAGREQPERRVLAIHALTRASPASATKLLPDLLDPRHPAAVQAAAARALGELNDKGLATEVLDRWGTLTTITRRDLLAAFLRSPDLAAVLLDGIGQEKLAPAELDPAAREALRRIPRPELQKRAEKLLGKGQLTDRQEVLRKYQPALGLAGSRERGANLFTKNCVTCHQVQGRGHRVGPDLSGITGRPREALLADILDPSKEVAPDFINYVLITTRGQVLTGLLAAETATSVTLRRALGAEDTVLRTEIQELRATGKSLMPEGLEQTHSLQDVADLLLFLQTRTPEKR